MNRSGRAAFVTGTDTGIGKTFVSRILADCFAELGPSTYMKPVQTGCIRGPDGLLRAPDFDYVMQGSARMVADLDTHVPYRFEPACSPHLAASLARRDIRLDHIRECFGRIRQPGSTVLVEGAGGVLAPLDQTLSMIDLIGRLELAAIVVAGARLGTLNHTFLTLKALHETGIRIAGVVLNCHDGATRDFIHDDNSHMIRQRVYPIPFLEVPHGLPDTDAVREFCRAIERRL